MSEKTLSPGEIALVDTVSGVIAALSLCGSTFIIVCFIRLRELRTFAFSLVAILSATDACNIIFDLISPPASDLEAMVAHQIPVTARCYAQAIGNSFFQLSSVLWTSAIATTLYLSVIRLKRPSQIEAYLPWFLAVCWGIPAVMAALPFIDSAYGPAGGWCWVVEDAIQWRFIQFYGPLWAAVLYNALVYLSVVRLLRRTLELSGQDETALLIRQLLRRLNIYPFILVVCWFWPTVNRVYESVTGGDQLLWLYILQRVSSSSQGALNAFAYGLTPGIREALYNALVSSCPACLGLKARGGGSGGSPTRGGGGEPGSPGGIRLHRPWSAGPGSGGHGTGGGTVAAAHASPPGFLDGRPVRLISFGDSVDGAELDDSGLAMSVLSRAQVGAPVVVPNPLLGAAAGPAGDIGTAR